MERDVRRLCRRLGIDDPAFVEIESKWKVLPEDAEALRDWLASRRGTEKVRKRVFFDQFLDTPDLRVLKAGASLRLRYKGDGAQVYLQYKGPGFHRDGLLFRSEFSSERLDHVVLEQSHHDIVHFTDTSVREILARRAPPAMIRAMRDHLGARTIARINRSPILCIYQKEKFNVVLNGTFLEPSLDRLYAFRIRGKGVHPLSVFWEYENEIKARDNDLTSKLKHLKELRAFDEAAARKFALRPERLDKYHRCASCFVALGRRKRRGGAAGRLRV